MAKTQIKNYVFKPGIGATDNLYPNAYSLLESNKAFIQKEATAWIQTQVDAGATGFLNYTYNQAKCERDVGFIIDAYLYDMRYGGNSKTSKYVSYYWDQGVAQVDGDRQPEIQTHGFIRDLITDNIFTNTLYSADNTEVTQTTTSTNAETQASARIDVLSGIVIDVITDGLDSLPTLDPSGVGYIKIQGKHSADEILLISNATKSEVMYNFTNVATGAKVTVTSDGKKDTDFPSYVQTTDSVTLIELNYDTSNHSTDDDIQIFVEKIENGRSVVTTRPYDFGSDAIERMRIAPPLSMLDADFEYGLQPTKWAAIATLRGYPSVYELPGTDTQVISVVTDGSIGSEGVGQSLITVTTVLPHGFIPGTPITIKALEDGVVGAARAEGSFVIVTVPTNNTFTYYAKSKVGTDGDVLSTTYTQLRQAGFYTGASIGNPDFSIASQGSSGVMTTELAVLSGSTIIPYDDQAPEIGSPLTDDDTDNIPLGSQVTGIIDQSQGGGLYITPTTVGDVSASTNEVTVSNIAGIVENLAVDRGDGFAIYVSSIAGNTLTFSDNFTEPVIGNRTDYTNLTGTNDASEGENAKFDISFATDSSFTYVVDAIANDGGENYAVGDRIIIPGTSLGGTSPENDALITVTEISNSADSIVAVEISGTHFNNDIYLPAQSAVFQGGNGEEASFDVSFENGSFTSVAVGTEAGTGYAVGDVLLIEGFIFSSNAAPSQYLKIGVDTVDVNGAITSISFTGNAPSVNRSVTNPTYSTTSVSGTNAAFDIVVNGSNYEVTFTNTGVNYLATENFTVAGDLLGGATPANDCTIVIDNVGANGEVTATTVSGVTFNGDTQNGLPGTNVTPAEATFNVSQNGAQYVVEIADPGENYYTGQELVISGTTFNAESPENDLTITVTSVIDLDDGGITGVTSAGTGYEPIGIYIDVLGVNDPGAGVGAVFSLTRDNRVYGSILATTAGTDYKVGDRIVIPGFQLGGISPLNDLTIRVSTVDGLGAITAFTPDFIEATAGTPFDLISTVQMAEATTGDMARGTSISFGALATLQVDFDNAHGLVPGDTFIVSSSSDDGTGNNHALADGSFFVTDIPSATSLRYQARAQGSIDVTEQQIIGTIYPRPDSFFVHRPYDGGVQLGTGGPQHGAQAIRQSKKYIRYQSGKGIMYTTGALFAPSYDLRSVTAEDVEVNSLITVVTDDNDHGVQEGGIVRLIGIETPGYNSGPETAVPPRFDYEVVEVIDERTFKIRAQRRLGGTEAILGFGAQMSVVSWHGATVRSGIFDDQNGIFWEFDGTQISVVQRTGTRQLAGTIAMTVDTNLITGTNTRFRDQLKAGDRIIIKGMTHVVSHVVSQTECTVTPDWRGVVNITGAKANLIVDKKTKQRDFNLDSLDGNGPSGYNLDVAKMQMIGIQYSWYGAGFIDFMLRGADGNFVYAHRMRNSNVNTEAFMRSGNLPVRYEVSNEGPPGKLKEAMDDSQVTMTLEDTSFFPEYGTVYIDNEIIDFTGKNDSTNQLIGLTRGATFENFQAGANRQYTAGNAVAHSARTGVVLISQTITPLISHWGSAFITDGGFDDDRGYIFSYAATGLDISTTRNTTFLIRLAPSVSNALVGDLGERELLNRAQLLLQGLEITSDTGDGKGIVIEGILNPQNYPINPNDVGWQELSGLAQGGQPSFAQVAPGGSVVWSSGDTSVQTAVTTQAPITATVVAKDRGWRSNDTSWDNTLDNDRDYFFVLDSFYQANRGLFENGVGVQTASGNLFPAGTTVTGVATFTDRTRSIGNVRRIFTSQDPNSNVVNQDRDIVLTKTFKAAPTNEIFFNKASFDSAGVGQGTTVSDAKFPAGTAVSSVNLETYNSTEYYRVNFNQSSDNTAITAGTTTVTFDFTQPPFAQPGETIFSFIAQAGERSTLDLSALKELTNTPLGGRGTFPNGPDVLAINVYKVSGTDTIANVILRWGEAQA